MKAYTNLEQSRKLAGILPLESADMYWDYDVQKHEHYPMVMDDQFDDTCICAWSLTALLDILNYPSLYQDVENKWSVTDWTGGYPKSKYFFDSPVYACVAMIENLHELKLI